jgi:RNA polymerase sigma factor (sigma-70 family)
MAAEAAQISLNGTSSSPVAAATLRSDADQAVTDMYQAQYSSLVRLTTLLTGDAGAAERVVQDSFVDMHRSWSRLQGPDRALSYLRRSVVIRSRSVPRFRDCDPAASVRAQDEVADQIPAGPPGSASIVSAIWELPPRQREAVVFRFYLGLPEGQIASAMGISRSAVRAHTARAVAALQGTP